MPSDNSIPYAFEEIHKVAVIGAGDMGHGIAELCALASYPVVLYDIDRKYIDRGIERIRDSLATLARKRKIPKDRVDSILALITPQPDLKAAVAEVELVIEAVPEILSIKQEVYAKIEAATAPRTIIATNTSTISITTLAQNLKYPGRFIGTHFFNPVILMKAVEVIAGAQSDFIAIRCAEKFLIATGQMPVAMTDSPGFVVNRILASTSVLVTQAVAHHFCTPEEFDGMMLNLGMPMGIFETMDYVGLDITFHMLDYLGNHLGQDYAPPAWLHDLVQQKKLGKKSGVGIYNWSAGRPQIPLNEKSLPLTAFDLMAVQINEAYKILNEGIVPTMKEIDLLITKGTSNSLGLGNLAKMEQQKVQERCQYFFELFNLNLFKPVSLID
jgi:enoyl-CoA hydratase/3-hydroxyacyl-CoA dehydrogenase